MYKTDEEMTVQELLLDAYKDQITTYMRLLSIKDEQVALLKIHIQGLEKDLEQCRVKHQNSTGLTAKEREELAKLSKEIMDESLEENEWPEEMTIELELKDFNKTLREALTCAFGILDDSKENTTNKNSDANGPCANPYPNRQESIVERYLSFRNSFTKLKWFELERLIESKFNEKAGKLLLDDSDIDSILQQFESSKD